jgi:hypothetical protein
MSAPDAEVDEITAEPPSSPSYREGASMWVWDDAGRFAFPRIGIEAVGQTWTTSFDTSFCMARPGGGLLIVNGSHEPLPIEDSEGRPRVFGAGPLRLDCLEPFARWRLEFDGDVTVTDADRFLGGGRPKLRLGEGLHEVPVRLRVDATSLAPPWFQGTQEPEGRFVAGERRFEQLCGVTGAVVVDGTETEFRGGALRIHRKGGDRNDYGEFFGHNWQSARFPSGRAFGFIHYRPRPDGSVVYREGWVLDGDEVLPAKVEDTPWMTGTRAAGEDVSFRLRTAKGEIAIQGETFVSSIRPPRPTGKGTTFPLLHSGIARYRWDGEQAYGMIERSSRLALRVAPD